MAAQAYTDLFNTAINTLAAKLNTVTGLVCVTDPRNCAAAMCTARRAVIYGI
jgi:hypothetical protein